MKQQTIDSATSYTIGGTGLLISQLTDVATFAQAITVILACVVVAIRLVHDAVKLYRFWRNRE